MTTWTVKPSGGDYTALSDALSNGSTLDNDTIEISGDWTSATDTTACTVADIGITVQTKAGDPARHAGFDNGGTNYELANSANDHVIQVNQTGCIIDGLILKQASTSNSDEAIRMAATGGTFTLKNSILWSGAATNQQDGMFSSETATVNLENCFIFGFGRSAVQKQGPGAVTWNINSCGFYSCGSVDSAGDEGGIVHTNGTSSVYNIHNTWVIDCDSLGSDYLETIAGTWNISFSIDSDNSIATVQDTGTGTLASRVINESTGGGNEIIVVDKTSLPYDLTLVDDATNNDAQDAHTTDTAHSVTILSTDIRAVTRPQNTSHDIGPFEVEVIVIAVLRESRYLLTRDLTNF